MRNARYHGAPTYVVGTGSVVALEPQVIVVTEVVNVCVSVDVQNFVLVNNYERLKD